jgi:predicted lipoprotein with Yx(FWY)xxD motif
MTPTNRGAMGLAVLGALTALTSGLALPASSSAAPAKAGTVVSTAPSKLGRVLVDRQGRTLYLFEKDAMDRSSCAGACASYWPPLLTTGKPAAGTGVHAGLLGTTKRADGTLQVTYNRHPLYRFSPDARPGLTKGQNVHAFGADWYVLSAAGSKIDRDAPAKGSTSAQSGGAGNGSSY